ncbi:MAG: hypothetical protein ACHRHE_04795 [Tepidisphaerales bacterium]
MSDQARRKERQRQKRKAKQEMIRKQNAVSPYKRLAEGRLVTCLVNEGWKEKGMADVHVLRVGPAGIAGVAVFLVDCWCAGLKDAYGRIGVSQSEYLRNVRQRAQDAGLDHVEIPLEEAARVVAGGIRFAVQNGFRLPSHYDRWLPFVGSVDWRTADLTGFGRANGELLWMGSREDLRKRLIGCTVEEFLQRADVKYIMEVSPDEPVSIAGNEFDDEEDDDDTEDEDPGVSAIDASLSKCARALAEATRVWCGRNSVKFDPGVERVAWLMLFCRAARESLRTANGVTPAEYMRMTAMDEQATQEMIQEPLVGAFRLFSRFLQATAAFDDLTSASKAALRGTPAVEQVGQPRIVVPPAEQPHAEPQTT